jgi:hypothetical protein
MDMSCLENAEDLPQEIRNLTKLEIVVIDNGNGCQMNISIPASIYRQSEKIACLAALWCVGCTGISG